MGGWFDTQLTLGDIDKIVLCDHIGWVLCILAVQ